MSSYVEDIEPSMNYDSKQTYINSFNDLTSLIITIRGSVKHYHWLNRNYKIL